MSTARRTTTRVGGWSLIVAAVSFMLVFTWLAVSFGYPDVLDGRADTVLPALITLGGTGRAVWIGYALIPWLMIPAAIASAEVWRRDSRVASTTALVLGVITAVCMSAGLARWSTMHWQLALAWADAAPPAREAMRAVFAGANQYLGTFVGEFLGEVALSAFFLATAYGMSRRIETRWHSRAGYAMGVIGLLASLRNVAAFAQPISAANNYLLPLWLVVLGVVLIRHHDRSHVIT